MSSSNATGLIGCLVEPTDDVSGTQSGCRSRAFWFYFLDDRAFLPGRIEQLPAHFSSANRGSPLCRVPPYGLHLAVSLEFHRNASRPHFARRPS